MELKELRVSNDVVNDPTELQSRIREEGYLFFRKLQSADKLHDLRVKMMTAIQNAGWLIQGTDPIDGIASCRRRGPCRAIDRLDRKDVSHHRRHRVSIISVDGRVFCLGFGTT